MTHQIIEITSTNRSGQTLWYWRCDCGKKGSGSYAYDNAVKGGQRHTWQLKNPRYR